MPSPLKICIPKKTKDINVKAFNLITNKNEAKTMAEHISCDCKCKLNSTTCDPNQKRECKNYHKCEKGYGWNLNTCICENSKYLKSIANTSGLHVMKLYLLWILNQQKAQML